MFTGKAASGIIRWHHNDSDVFDGERQVRNRVILGIEQTSLNACSQEPLPLGIVTVEDCPCAHQCGRGDHEPRRPDESNPLEMRQEFGIELGHRSQFVSGQR